MATRTLWLVLILLAAAAFRFHALEAAPPGITHDEADHGLDAWGVVNGVRPLYFTVGYGREPLYDYATAGLMSFLGPTVLAGRLTSAFFSLLLIAGSYAWTRRAFGERAALLTAAGLAVSFWPIMTGRQMLRSVTLPALFVLAATLYWLALGRSRRATGGAGRSALALYVAAGLMLGLTLYTYLPARIMWLAYPALLLYLAAAGRPLLARAWRGTLVTLVVALVVSLPLILYLRANPAAEVRLAQLSRPLAEARAGNLEPLAEAMAAGAATLAVRGDDQWRYNLAGRPFWPPAVAALGAAGFLILLWLAGRAVVRPGGAGRSGGPAAFFALAWLVLGLAPVALTGPALSTTRLIGAQPMLYLLPALPLAALIGLRRPAGDLAAAATAAGLALLAFQGAHAYFDQWANHPQVRVQYESALVSTLDYLSDRAEGRVAISTTTPGRFHSQAVALLTVEDNGIDFAWFDGRHSLLIPDQGPGLVVLTGFAPLDPALQPYFQGSLAATLPLRPSDLDRPVSVYRADGQSWRDSWERLFSTGLAAPAADEGDAIPVGDALLFMGHHVQTQTLRPGDEVRVATLWRAVRPAEELVLFSQMLGPDGRPAAQDDRLDVPSSQWREGDVFIQLHRFSVPDGAAPGLYPLIVGAYQAAGGRRLAVQLAGGLSDHLSLPALRVEE
jgi:hypothetical protein